VYTAQAVQSTLVLCVGCMIGCLVTGKCQWALCTFLSGRLEESTLGVAELILFSPSIPGGPLTLPACTQLWKNRGGRAWLCCAPPLTTAVGIFNLFHLHYHVDCSNKCDFGLRSRLGLLLLLLLLLLT